MNTKERDNAYMEYIIKMSRTATFPCGRGKLLKDFGKATGNQFRERLYEKRFDVISQKILNSCYSLVNKARAFFYASIHIKSPKFLKDLEKIATIKLDDEGRIIEFQSKIGPKVHFFGKHRMTPSQGRSRSHIMEEEGNEEEEDDDIIIDDAYPVQQPHHHQVTVRGSMSGGAEFGQEIREQKPFDYGYQAPLPNQPGPSEVVFPHDIKQDPSELLMRSMDPMRENSAGRISTAPSIASLHNFHQPENYYANFLKGVHFFLQDYAKNPLELKKMAREAKENHLGMNITPKTLISYLDVCLGDVICLDSVPQHPEGVVNLKEFLEELKKCAEDFGDVLRTKIVITVDGININIRDDDRVPLTGVLESFSGMVRKLKVRVEKLEHRGG